MKLKQIYNSAKPILSFEIFPPKAQTPEELKIKTDELFSELAVLAEFSPAFISVTYGAGGSTQEKTLELVEKIKITLNIPPVPHFTCVGSSRAFIREYLKKIEHAGIENILALRGDPPKDQGCFVKPEDGFGYANELAAFIKSETNLGIAVAAYPECHQDCCDHKKDIENLKRKVDSGAELIITQLFYDNSSFFSFLQNIRRVGITVPIAAGILPITAYSQLERIVKLSGCQLPKQFEAELEANKDKKAAIQEIGLNFCVNQCMELVKNGIDGLHFYTLNKSFSTKSVLDKLKSGNFL